MFRKRLYFNDIYLIKGYMLFGKIRGVVVGTKSPTTYPKGKKITVNPDTFKEISEDQLIVLEKFGFINFSNG